MIKIIARLIFSSFVMTISNAQFIEYSSAEIYQHKLTCEQKIKTNTRYLHDPHYQMQRALKTIAATDSDYIPKIVGAGEIFMNDLVPYQLMHNGIKIIVNSYYDAEWITDVIYALKGHHEPQEERCFHEILKYIPESATMIELGSYWAYYSLWFATAIKNSHNYMIEPDPIRLETGKKNFALNNKSGTFVRGFVGLLKDNEPNVDGAHWISIDQFIKDQDIAHVHLLHADIQGAESQMLETAIENLNNIDYFFISTHDPMNDHLPCLTFFKKHGFIILAEHTTLESCGGDGLIVAKRPGVLGPDSISINKY